MIRNLSKISLKKIRIFSKISPKSVRRFSQFSQKLLFQENVVKIFPIIYPKSSDNKFSLNSLNFFKKSFIISSKSISNFAEISS